MTPRPKKKPPARKRIVSFAPWEPKHRDIFRLADDDWTPPAQIRLTRTIGSSRVAWEADFAAPGGHVYRLRVRVDLALAQILEESLSVRFVFRRGDAGK